MAEQADETNRQGPEPRSDAAAMLDEFHTTFDYVRAAEPSLRVTLHTEEHKELVTALESEGLDQIARELADVVYVAYGSAWSLGIDLDAAIAEVHASNMSKLDDEGKPIYREDGKVMKGPNFRKPDMSAAIADSPFLGEIVGTPDETPPTRVERRSWWSESDLLGRRQPEAAHGDQDAAPSAGDAGTIGKAAIGLAKIMLLLTPYLLYAGILYGIFALCGWGLVFVAVVAVCSPALWEATPRYAIFLDRRFQRRQSPE